MTLLTILAAATGSSAPVLVPPFIADVGPARNVGGQLSALGGGWIPGTGTATVTKHSMHANATSIILGWHVRQSEKTLAVASETIQAWVRSASVGWTQVTFNEGADTTATVIATDTNTNIYTDPIPGPWRANEPISVAAWGAAVGSDTALASHDGLASGWDGGSYTGPASGVVAAATAGSLTNSPMQRTMKPALILAPSPELARGSWLCVGDSILAFQYDPYTNQAFRARQLPYTFNGLGGETALQVTSDPVFALRAAEALVYCDSVFVQYGRNDLGSGTTLQGSLLALWAKCLAAGAVRVAQATITPRINSVDGFTTIEGQTPMGSTDRSLVNLWLMDGAPVVAGSAVPAGSTDPAAVRATRVSLAGEVVIGSPLHPLGDGGFITSAPAIIETAVDSNLARVDAGPMLSDQVHITKPAHDLIAGILARDLQLVGF